MNPALRSYLLERHETTKHAEPPTPVEPVNPPASRRHRLRDRLSEHDFSTLVASFKTGTPAHVLAKHYGVSETSLKALLKQRGVRRRSHQPPQDEANNR